MAAESLGPMDGSPLGFTQEVLIRCKRRVRSWVKLVCREEVGVRVVGKVLCINVHGYFSPGSPNNKKSGLYMSSMCSVKVIANVGK